MFTFYLLITMSKELGDAVEKLYNKEQIRKKAGSVAYAIKSEINDISNKVMAMIKSRHKIPKDSKYYAQIVRVEQGEHFGTYKKTIETFTREYPQYANAINNIFERHKKELKESLDYGLKKDLEKKK